MNQKGYKKDELAIVVAKDNRGKTKISKDEREQLDEDLRDWPPEVRRKIKQSTVVGD